MQSNYMRLGAITVMQNLRAMVGRHEAKFAGRQGAIEMIPPVIGTTCDVSTKLVSLYARATQRVFPGIGLSRTIELARIEVAPRYRGKGFLKYVAKEMEDLADLTGRVVYIESIVNDDLWFHFTENRTGYKPFPSNTGGWPNSLYRLPLSLKDAVKGCVQCGK